VGVFEDGDVPKIPYRPQMVAKPFIICKEMVVFIGNPYSDIHLLIILNAILVGYDGIVLEFFRSFLHVFDEIFVEGIVIVKISSE
jgi:hypothetical protein